MAKPTDDSAGGAAVTSLEAELPGGAGLWGGPRAVAPAATEGGDIDIQADSDDRALGRFLAGVEKKAFLVARGALWDEQLALDVVQDAMLKLVEHYRGRPGTEWPALFFTILRNRIRDAQRRRMVRERAGRVVSLFERRRGEDGEQDRLETELAGQAPSSGGDPDRRLASKEARAALDRALAGLSWRQRQVFMLREELGLGIQETAAALGCSAGSVKQHHFRAMQALRRQLAEDWQDE